MASTEKINFNVPAKVKQDIERLAISHGKTLSAFLCEVCIILVNANAERIKAQAQREKEPINFGGAVEITKPAQADDVIGGDENG